MFSVLMSVYAKELPECLDRALFSIWDEQKLKPSEIVLVKDGLLTEQLNSIVEKWSERLGSRLQVVELDSNVGLAVALNRGLELCSYELVARMDSDDISLPERFELQVKYMDENRKIAASSSYVEEWDPISGKITGVRLLPNDNSQLKKFARSRSPLSHPAVIFRKSAVEAVGGYPELRNAQDYALWSLLLVHGYQLSNISEILLRMRVGEGLITRRGKDYFKQELKLLKFQKNIGFLSLPRYVLNALSKFFLRMSGNRVKIFLYKYFR